jgi:hypothetical protein
MYFLMSHICKCDVVVKVEVRLLDCKGFGQAIAKYEIAHHWVKRVLNVILGFTHFLQMADSSGDSVLQFFEKPVSPLAQLKDGGNPMSGCRVRWIIAYLY